MDLRKSTEPSKEHESNGYMIAERICKGLARWYAHQGKADEYDAVFLSFCKENEFEDEVMEGLLQDEVEENQLLDCFEDLDDFPFDPVNNPKDESAKKEVILNLIRGLADRSTNNSAYLQKGADSDDGKDDDDVKEPERPHSFKFTEEMLLHAMSTDTQNSQELILEPGKDRRNLVPPKLFDNPSHPIHSIGMLVMRMDEWRTGTIARGTGTVIARRGQIAYILTCAHNIVRVEQNLVTEEWTKKKYDQICFMTRSNYGDTASGGYGSSVLDRFEVTESIYHPMYFNPKKGDINIYDIGILKVNDRNNRLSGFKLLKMRSSQNKRGKVVGFPLMYQFNKTTAMVEMSGKLKYKKAKTMTWTKSLITYPIDTTGGQSGSPIIAVGKEDVIGVHTKGNMMDNFGVYLNKEKIKWVNRETGKMFIF